MKKEDLIFLRDFERKRRYYEIEDKMKIDGQDNYKLEELKLKIK